MSDTNFNMLTPNAVRHGWAGADAAKQAWDMLGEQFPQFFIAGQTQGATGAKLLLWEFAKKVNGGNHLPTFRQEIGDCVSMGASNAVDYVACVEIAKEGQNEKYRPTYQPYIYGISRVQIGNRQLGRGDGSVGAWAALGCQKYGTLPADEPGVPAYSGSVASDWGWSGPPQKWIDIAKPHVIKSAAKVTSYEMVREAIANGYPVTVASNRGFKMTPVVDRGKSWGIASGSWSHQMCYQKDTIIKMPVSKMIQNVCVGDKVFDMHGDLKTVTEVFSRYYKGKAVKIRVSGREAFTVTPNHPVLVFRRAVCGVSVHSAVDIQLYANKEYKLDKKSSGLYIGEHVASWVKAGEIAKGDIVICPRPKSGQMNYELPKWIGSGGQRKTLPPLQYDQELAWLFGLYTADGTAIKGHKIIITLDAKSIETIDRCVQAIQKLGLNPTVKHYETFVRVIAYSATLADSMREWFGVKEEKKIPEWIFSGWDLEEFVKGFSAGDGVDGMPEGSGKLYNTNPIIIDQLHSMLLMLGKSPYVNRLTWNPEKYHNFKDRYEISWKDDTKTQRCWWSDSNYVSSVRSVEEVDFEGEVYNFEVEDTHSYIAAGIVSHNCFIGVDDDSARPGCYLLNSWGANAHGTPADGAPPGGFWVDADVVNQMVRQDDSFAYSQYEGFPEQKFDWLMI